MSLTGGLRNRISFFEERIQGQSIYAQTIPEIPSSSRNTLAPKLFIETSASSEQTRNNLDIVGNAPRLDTSEDNPFEPEIHAEYSKTTSMYNQHLFVPSSGPRTRESTASQKKAENDSFVPWSVGAGVGSSVQSQPASPPARSPSSSVKRQSSVSSIQSQSSVISKQSIVDNNKRQVVVKEIVDTERTYLSDLLVMKEVYVVDSVLPPGDVRVLFGHIDLIIDISDDLLRLLGGTETTIDDYNRIVGN
jgi:hypothetical protein